MYLYESGLGNSIDVLPLHIIAVTAGCCLSAKEQVIKQFLDLLKSKLVCSMQESM